MTRGLQERTGYPGAATLRNENQDVISLRIAALALLVFVVGACSDRGSDAVQSTFEVDSSGEFPIVTVHAAPVWRAVPVVSIGAREGESVEFASIRSVLLDSAGTLIVVDPRNRSVREFDSTGRLVRHIGREGAGPGEYRDPYSVAWLDGHLALLDPGNPRLAVFDRVGGWITSWPTQPITGPFIRLYRTPPTFFAYAFRRTATGAENIYVGYERSGPRDTVVAAPRPMDLVPGARCSRPDGGLSFFSNPYAAAFLGIPLSGGRQAVARTDAYRISILNRQRDTMLVLAADVTPSAVTDADWEEGMADWEKFHRDWPTARCDRTSFTRPVSKPVLSWLFVDGEGRLWVEVLSNEGTRYDVFETDGQPIATVHGLPPTEGIDPSAANERIAFVVRDTATDVPSVRVFRLTRASRE